MRPTAIRHALFDALNRRFFYGWATLGVAMVGLLASGPGQSHTFSVFVGPISEDLELSRTQVASAYGLATLVAAFGLPQMGRFTDRYGPRAMLLVIAALLGIACLAFGALAHLVLLAVGFAALRFLGQGSLLLNCANLVSHWFDRKRGFALSLMGLGFSVSMAIHPPLAQWLIDHVGWRQAWIWLGLSTWILLIPAVWLLVHDRPEDVGLRPDGESRGENETPGAPPRGAVSGLTLREAVRTPTFYILCAGLFSLSMLVTALHFFQVSIFSAHGLDAQVAASVFAVSALTMVLTMPVIGRMLDRYPTERMFSGGLLIMAGSLVAATQVADWPSALAYAVVFGLNNAVTITLFAFMWPRYFGLLHLGSVQGTGQMVGIFGASLGPLPLGIAFDVLGSYDPVLLGLTALPLACSVLALFLRTPAKLVRRTAEAAARANQAND